MHSQSDMLYMDLIKSIVTNGDYVTSRNGSTYRLFKYDMTFNSTPLIHIRKTSWRTALREMEWFLSGSNRLANAHPSVHSWWKDWENSYGKIPYNYSTQFRNFAGHHRAVDQIEYLLKGLNEHPYSRRLVATTWNTADMTSKDCPITNCHGTIIHLNVDTNNRLHLFMYQRSVDVICGLPHNLIQYWAFMQWLAFKTNLTMGEFHWTGGDIHIYEEHLPIIEHLLKLDIDSIKPCHLIYNPNDNVNKLSPDDFKADDFFLTGDYQPLCDMKAKMIV